MVIDWTFSRVIESRTSRGSIDKLIVAVVFVLFIESKFLHLRSNDVAVSK